MEDRTKGAFASWRENVRRLELEDAAAASDPGAKPTTGLGRHWTAYKAVLADLEHEGRLDGDEANERRNRLRQTVALSAFRKGGRPYVHLHPK